MKNSIYSLLTPLLILSGCQTLPLQNETAPQKQTAQIKDWVFPVSLKANASLPEGFKKISAKDGAQLIVFDRALYRDVTVVTHFKPYKGKNDFGGGILFRYQNPDNYYCLRYNRGTNNLRFYKSIRGDRARFANRTLHLKKKDFWHELKLVSRGDLLQAYLDEKLIFSREDELIKEGKVGLWFYGSQPKTEFADLTIQP